MFGAEVIPEIVNLPAAIFASVMVKSAANDKAAVEDRKKAKELRSA